MCRCRNNDEGDEKLFLHLGCIHLQVYKYWFPSVAAVVWYVYTIKWTDLNIKEQICLSACLLPASCRHATMGTVCVQDLDLKQPNDIPPVYSRLIFLNRSRE